MSAASDPSAVGLLFDALVLDAGYNTAVAMLGSAALGIAAGVVGVFALLRRRSLLGDTLAHSMLPGICGAFLIGSAMGWTARSLPLLMAGALTSGTLGALCVRWLRGVRRFSDDLAMALVLAVFFGFGAVLLGVIVAQPTGNRAGLEGLLLGQAAAMLTRDAIVIGIAGLMCLGLCVALFKELRLVCFDERFAKAAGMPVRGIDLLLIGLILLVTVIGLQTVGLVLIVALLIIPASTARLWTDRLWLIGLIAGAVGGGSAYIGAGLSRAVAGVPTGAAIVLLAGAAFVASLLVSPRRGVLGVGLQRLRMRLRISEDHVLRHALESARPGEAIALTDRPALPIALLMRGRGLIVRADGRLVLSERGADEARRLTEAHELWEHYLEIYAGFDADRVHNPADMVEHVLSPQLTEALRERVERGRRARGAS